MKPGLTISLVTDEAASPEVREVFEKVRGVFGFVPNWVRMLAHAPHVMTALIELEMSVAGGGKIPAALKELAMMRTSELNSCGYCSAYHRHGLKKAGVDASKTDALAARERPGGGLFSDEETAVLDLTDEMTIGVRATPETVERAARLFGEDGVVELMATIGMLNFFNRMSLSTGISPDRW
jgi:uncharacterized peroxidase-related enzyme